MTTKPAAPRSLSQSMRGHDRLDIGREGQSERWYGDLYHRGVRASWPLFFIGFGAVFIALNLVFAGLYAFDPAGLVQVGERPGNSMLLKCFFFSVHTVATVGYGNIYPNSTYVNFVVVVEIALGVLVFAITSGLVFARFSIPRARTMFSDVAVICEFEGYPTLMFRAANQRNNFIVEASVRLSILRLEIDGARRMRRFYDMALLRPTSPVFALTWLVMHRIDETSPLFGMTQADFDARDDDLIVLMAGMDSSLSQTVMARHGYGPGRVMWDHEFVDVLREDENGRRWINFHNFHAVAPVAPPLSPE